MYRDREDRTIAKVPHITLSGKVSQYTYTVVCCDIAKPNKPKSTRIKLTFWVFNSQLHNGPIRYAQQNYGVIERLISLSGFVDNGVAITFQIVNTAGVPSRRELVDHRD